MLKILIVNSKKSDIENLRTIISRRTYDFNIVGLCQDTTSAVNVIKMSEVHLVLCEYSSENIDSNLIISEAERLSKSTLFVICGHVENAENIIAPSVLGYLPDTSQSRELYGLLDKAKENLDKQKLYLHFMQYAFLNNLHQGENSFYSMIMQKSSSPRTDSENYYYITVSYDATTEEYLSGKVASYDQIENFMFIKLFNFIGDEYSHGLFKVGLAEFGIVVSGHNFKSLGMTIYEYASAIKSLFYENNLSISVLVGRSVESINWINKSRESISALKIVKFYNESGVILHYDKTDNITFSAALSDASLKNSFISAIVDGNEKDITSTINALFKECSEKFITIECLKGIITDIVAEISRHILELGGDVKNVNYRYLSLDKLSDLTIDIVKVVMLDFAVKSNEYIKSLAKNDGVDIVNAIFEYVKTNFSEDISLQHFAKKHFINVSYLGQIFRKHIGISFNEYLMDTRINEAKKLLLSNKKIKVHEIAQKVGFKDANYFCMKFKIHEGITPTKYRTENTQKNEM